MIALENLPFVDFDDQTITAAREPPADAIVVQLTDGRVVWLARDNDGALLLMGTGMINPAVRDIIQEQFRNQPVTQVLSVVQPEKLAQPGYILVIGNAMYTGGYNSAFTVAEERKADRDMGQANYHTRHSRND